MNLRDLIHLAEATAPATVDPLSTEVIFVTPDIEDPDMDLDDLGCWADVIPTMGDAVEVIGTEYDPPDASWTGDESDADYSPTLWLYLGDRELFAAERAARADS